jgi:hypothetical protein
MFVDPEEKKARSEFRTETLRSGAVSTLNEKFVMTNNASKEVQILDAKRLEVWLHYRLILM